MTACTIPGGASDYRDGPMRLPSGSFVASPLKRLRASTLLPWSAENVSLDGFVR